MVSFQRKKNINAIKVAMKIIGTVIALWVGGFAYNIIATIVTNTSSPFFKGLKLVGFTVSTVDNGTTDTCNTGPDYGTDIPNCITGTNSTSLLAVIGVLAIFWIAFEFIDVRM